MKSVVVSRKTCARFSQELGLGEFLFLGKGVEQHGEIPSNMLRGRVRVAGRGDLPRRRLGRGPASSCFASSNRKSIGPWRTPTEHNSKSLLQQVTQQEYGGTPRYVVLDEQGPDHDKCFKIAATVERPPLPAGVGTQQEGSRAESRPQRVRRDRRQRRTVPLELSECDGNEALPRDLLSTRLRPVARFKIAARWSDGVTSELKTYSLCCEKCLAKNFADAKTRQATCPLALDEKLEPPSIFERVPKLQRREDLEASYSVAGG